MDLDLLAPTGGVRAGSMGMHACKPLGKQYVAAVSPSC